MNPSNGVPTTVTVRSFRAGRSREVRWPVTRLLGEGASAVVLAVETAEGERALKWARPGFEAVLEREARALHFLRGAGVPTLFEVLGVVDASGATRIGLLLELVEGPSLSEWLDAAPESTHRNELAERVFFELGATLGAIHRLGFAHGDVKPANVLIGRGGEPILIDWGLVGPAGASDLPGGTPRYLPPEFVSGASTTGALADAYALTLVTLETVSEEFRRADELAPTLERGLPPVWAERLGPFLAARPGRRASLALLEGPRFARASDPAGVERRLRQAYLRTREDVIELVVAAAPGASPSVEVTGRPAIWLEDAIAFQRALAELSPRPRDGAPESLGLANFGSMSSLERNRFFAFLFGPEGAGRPAAPSSDGELIDELLSFSDHHPLEVWSGHADERGTRFVPGVRFDAAEAALLFAERPVSGEFLRDLEVREDLPPALRLEAARVLRRRGEFDRALHFLEGFDDPSASLERALVWSRRGEGERAVELLSRFAAPSSANPAPSAPTPLEASQIGSFLARKQLDRGDASGALAALESLAPSSARSEVRALAELALGHFEKAREEVQSGRELSRHEEQEARLEGVEGMIEHALGDPERALVAFQKARESARRVEARLEEATYATGVAAAASDAGRLGVCLEAAERAAILFEVLGKRREQARALLAHASVLSRLEMDAELSVVASRAARVAGEEGDSRCAGYAELCLADGLGSRMARRAAAERAAKWLVDGTPADRLRAEARLLEHGGTLPLDGDARALDVVEREARIDWWKARALTLGSRPSEEETEIVLREIGTLAASITSRTSAARAVSNSTSETLALGPLLVAGAELALSVGRAKEARQLLVHAAPLAGRFVQGLDDEHRLRALELGWVKKAQSLAPAELAPEQLGEVEALLRSLGGREGLRPLLRQILDALLLWTGVERGLLLLPAPGGRLVVRAARNLRHADLTGEQLHLSRSMAERALVEGRPILAVDAARELSETHRSVHALKLRSVLALPLLARGKVVGVAYLDDRVRRGAFGEKEVSWANLIATIAALTIADARDRLDLERALRRARRAEARLAEEVSEKDLALELSERELARVQEGRALRGRYTNIVASSRAMQNLLALVDRVAQSEIPVLVTGESGTGKELIARALAANGPRKKAPFVAENCAAVPETLLESTLFGHVRGAFTGATQNRAGLFEVANGGTLLLDEIGEMTLPMQAKLLRVLQDGEIHKVGSERSIRVNVRVIAATHRDLEALVKQGKFREDLFYRLNVVGVRVPPLRERPEDVVPLAEHFLEKHGQGEKRSFSRAALECLRAYSWPGNVRQLENEVRRLVVLAGREIVRADLSQEVMGPLPIEPVGSTLKEQVDALERRLVQDALEETRGNRTRAAEILGLSRFGLQKMIQRLGIPESSKTSGSLRILEDGLDPDR